MKRFVAIAAALVASIVVSLGGTAAHAQDPRDIGCQRLCDPGCHRVYFTPPGWSQPVEVTVCP